MISLLKPEASTQRAISSTIWVGDLKNDTIHNGRLYIPWVNGASTNFSHPLSLTVDPGTRKPINQLRVRSLNNHGQAVGAGVGPHGGPLPEVSLHRERWY